jgi:hypothetical protein
MPIDFESHLSSLFSCGPTEIPGAAAKFILGFEDKSIESCGNGYRVIDKLIDSALDRFNVEVKNVTSAESSQLGRLYTKTRGFSLRIRRDLRESMYRFVKAHELAHVLAYDASFSRPRRLFANSRMEERLCDSIARHLLLPIEFVAPQLSKVAFTPDSFEVQEIVFLSREYFVTPWQVVRRAIEEHQSNKEYTVAILWKQESVDTLRIADRVSPSGVYIPLKDRSLKNRNNNHLLWEAAESSRVVKGEDFVKLGSLHGQLEGINFACASPWPSVVQVLQLDAVHRAKMSRWRTYHNYETALSETESSLCVI